MPCQQSPASLPMLTCHGADEQPPHRQGLRPRRRLESQAGEHLSQPGAAGRGHGAAAVGAAGRLHALHGHRHAAQLPILQPAPAGPNAACMCTDVGNHSHSSPPGGSSGLRTACSSRHVRNTAAGTRVTAAPPLTPPVHPDAVLAAGDQLCLPPGHKLERLHIIVAGLPAQLSRPAAAGSLHRPAGRHVPARQLLSPLGVHPSGCQQGAVGRQIQALGAARMACTARQ